MTARASSVGASLKDGDALTVLKTLPGESVRCCVTSPPYFGLRDYGMAGQLGLEKTPDEYVANLVAVFREVRRVLTTDGTLWLVIGDSYAANRGYQVPDSKHVDVGNARGMKAATLGLKAKDLVGIPWLLAFALRADGWYLRCDIIWAKPNPMPESVTDRPTKSHEYLFLLAKSERYYYDADAIAEKSLSVDDPRFGGPRIAYDVKTGPTAAPDYQGQRSAVTIRETRNARSVWTITTQSYAAAHFATFPEELARRCIVAGSAPGDVVLDPFGGSGTVAQVATGNGRSAIYIDLNPAYLELARQRIGPLLVTA